jgi:hypothetical protein
MSINARFKVIFEFNAVMDAGGNFTTTNEMDTRIDNHLNSFKLRIDTDAVKGRLLRATKAFSPGRNLDAFLNPIQAIIKIIQYTPRYTKYY